MVTETGGGVVVVRGVITVLLEVTGAGIVVTVVDGIGTGTGVVVVRGQYNV